MQARVAQVLRQIAEPEGGDLVVPLRITHRDIAAMVGASREMISRVFKDLSVGGYIEVEKNRITIARTLPDHW